jgi:hypothetical protein
MARPSFSIPFIASQTIQAAAGISLESVHDLFGPDLSFDNCMNVIGSHVQTSRSASAKRLPGIE